MVTIYLNFVIYKDQNSAVFLLTQSLFYKHINIYHNRFLKQQYTYERRTNYVF